ncbi:SAM-dependent methyltransferase [Shewanella mangrovi]|uniref:tRNA 5-carboxymethoxyuridine methyltransferase n=1 Tax=Shewanella mangrovi TaxID=1515746 RepID=A0A094JFM2_9GAMM|nr:methyltransferase [Shewanella mangrovi]KFZ36819.1 SAM-dependent methyltransferase [Shewanella mangrovi]
MQDKNFDTLVGKFANNIYGTPKGEIRAAVMWRDLQEMLATTEKRPLRILDAGGGFGYFSMKLARLGHEVVLCDISRNMLNEAQRLLDEEPEPLNVSLIHSPIQALSANTLGQFDMILCHAVVEWLADAKATMENLLTLLTPNGLFSLMFYNIEAMRFHALISGNFDYVNNGLKARKKSRLSPDHPLAIAEVESWFAEWQLQTLGMSGVRVIHDYMNRRLPVDFSPAQLVEMELAYSRQQPYLSLARYVHLMGRKAAN